MSSPHLRFELSCAPLAWALLLGACAAPAPAPNPQPPPPSGPRDALLQSFVDEAAAVRPLVAASRLAQRFLDQAASLRPRETRHVVIDGKARDVDEEMYYAARWGTPIAYARVLALVDSAGAKGGPGARWLDFGFGAPGHLQMLASLGLDVVGVDVDLLGRAIYDDPSDVDVPRGKLALRYGSWPAEGEGLVGAPFDVIISKNVLKRGYIHPAREADPKHLVHLGVDDHAFLVAVHDALKPEGLFAIWNLCPAQAPPDKPYIPWADGESPFTREDFAAAGFEVLALSVDDTEQARLMARALKFDAPGDDGSPGWDIEHELHAWFTLVRRAHD